MNAPADDRYWQNWDAGDTAERIDAFWLDNPFEQASRKALAEEVRRVFDGAPLYEVGCGTGLMTTALFEEGWSAETYAGGDVSESMLAIARKRHPDVAFEHADILALQGGRENVVCLHVLQHLPHYRDALAQLVRFTTRRLHIVTWLPDIPEDDIRFSPAGLNPGDQSFHDNRYALASFIAELERLAGAPPEVRRMSDLTCSVVVRRGA